MWLSCNHQQDSYNYGRPAAVTTYDNKQYYQTTIATAQRTPTENYYQTGESAYLNFRCPNIICIDFCFSWIITLSGNNSG